MKMTIKSLAGAAALAMSLALGACNQGTTNTGLTPVHQPVVQRTDYALDLAAGAGGLGTSEQQRLSIWFETLELGYGDRITIDDSSTPSAEVREDVARAAARHGMLLQEGSPVTDGQIAPGNVRVIVSRTTATVPGCPDWSRPSQPDFQAATMSNFGCAISTNLAAMIANPEDLIHGQAGSGGSDAQAISKAVKVFRDKVPTGVGELKKESSKGQ